MRKTVEIWTQLALFRKIGPLRIAGFGTEELCKELHERPEAVEILGPLSQKELQDQLVQTRALLCYQDDGSGTLTRITEQLIAGVPVIANRHAARSHHGLPGLVEFECWDDFPSAIKALDTLHTGFPFPLPPDTSRLLDDLRRLARAQTS